MSLKTLTTFVLAAGLAASKPIHSKRQAQDISAVVNGFSANSNSFNFIDGFNAFNQQPQALQVKSNNLQIVDASVQQRVVQQVNEVLIVDQVNNGFNNDLNNLFRKSNFQNQFQEVSTVMLVVQEIQVAVDNGAAAQNIFAQSALVANRGAAETQTVMVFDPRTLVAQDILAGDAFANIGQVGGIAGATAVLEGQLPTKTAGIQLFDAKPTWTDVQEDPAATLGAIWQAALEDLQKKDEDEKDNELNDRVAELEKKLDALEEEQEDDDKEDKKDDDKEEDKEQAEKDEEQKKEDEKKQAEEDAKKEEEKKQAEEDAKKEEEKMQAEEDAKKQAEEDAKKQAEEEQKKADEEAKKQAEEEQKKADEEAKKQAEEDAKKQAEEEQKKAEEEDKMQPEEEENKAEDEAKMQAEEEQKKADEAAKIQAEEEAKMQADEEQKKAAEEAMKQAEAEAAPEAKA